MHLIAILMNPALFGTLVLFLSVLWMLRDTTDRTRPLLVFAVALNLFYGFLMTVFMSREGSLFPWKYDPILFHMDESLGIRAAWIARPLQGVWHVPLWVVYEAMIPMMICWFLVTSYRKHRGSVVLAYVAELTAGPLIYTIVPACGPVYAFGAKWIHAPLPAAEVMRLAGLPNAFPSLHVATAMVFVFLAPGRMWRGAALAFLAFTCLATLALGEHYAIDLIPGFAFGVFAGYVGLREFRRASFFLGVVCGWSVAVRFGFTFLTGYPIVTRCCAALTVALVTIAVWNEWSAQAEPETTASNSQATAAVTPLD